jgi:formimidoylglutamate deiminase
MDEESFYELVLQCFNEMRRGGVTTVGEFHYFHHHTPGDYAYDQLVLKAAKDAGLRIALLSVYYEYAGLHQAPLEAAQQRFKTASIEEYFSQLETLEATLESTQTLGVVAHSIRAVGLENIQRLSTEAQKRGMVMHMHLEEQPQEVADTIAAYGAPPMRVLLDADVVWDGFTAVHCTHTRPEDMAPFVERGGNVNICPLTEGNLGDGIADLSLCGGRISLGSDCNARIDMLEEMRWLEYVQRVHAIQRGVLSQNVDRPGHQASTEIGQELFACATTSGARALGLPTGEIAPGLMADFALIQLDAQALVGWQRETLMESIVFGCGGEQVVAGTCVGGQWHLPDQYSYSGFS